MPMAVVLPDIERLIGEAVLALKDEIDNAPDVETAETLHDRVVAMAALLLTVQSRSRRHLDRLKRAAKAAL